MSSELFVLCLLEPNRSNCNYIRDVQRVKSYMCCLELKPQSFEEISCELKTQYPYATCLIPIKRSVLSEIKPGYY